MLTLLHQNFPGKGTKVTGMHEGFIIFMSGNLKFQGDNLAVGELTVNMNSIDVTDLQGGGKCKLEGHLKSDDFFRITSYPASTIKFTKVNSRGTSGEYKITINITKKNTTKEIKFIATVKAGSGTAAIKLDRSDFYIRYG
jgi:polyisoprenoid-binding protein YceI